MSVHHFEVFGQHIATAQAWYSNTYSDSVYIKDVSGEFSYGRSNYHEMAFYDIEDAVPFNILTYFMQKYNNDLTQFIQGTYLETWNLETGEQVNWDGSESGNYQNYFYIGYRYDGLHNSIHFVGGLGDTITPTRIVSAHGTIGYYGMSLSTGPNANDIRMAELYVIKFLENKDFEEMEGDEGYYPDWTRGHGNEEGTYTFPRGEGYRMALNGTVYEQWGGNYYFFNTSGITFIQDPLEIATSPAVVMTTPYYSGGWWWGPDPRNCPRYSRYYRPNMLASDWDTSWWYLDELTFFIPEDTPEPEPEPAPGEDGGGGVVNGGGGGGRDGFGTHSLEPVKDMVPQTGFVESGLGNIYNVPSANLRALSNFLWSDDFIENIKQLNANAMDCIYNLTWMPINLSTMKNKGNSVRGGLIPIFCGNVDTQVNGYGLRKSYGEVWYKNIDLTSSPSGTKLGEMYGTALDYHPDTTIQLYLPFIGMTELDPNDIFSPMTWTNKSCKISIQYIVNLFNGDAVAKVYIDRPKPNRNMSNSDGSYTNVIGQFECNIGFTIPLTGANYAQYYKNKFSSVVGMVSGGANALTSLMTNPVNAFGGLASMADSWLQGQTTAPNIMKAGSASGASAPMSCWIPYVQILRPAGVYSKYVDYRPMNGIPANNYCSTIGSLTNTMDDSYYEFISVKTEGFHGTDDEEKELINILKTGVYINS